MAPTASAAEATATPTATSTSLLAQGGESDQQSCELILYPMVKDDRTVPAQWTDPSSLMFGISDAARNVSPVDIGPILANQEVWMISSSQVPGVPWLGANTQHETFSTQTTGEVTMEITSYSGPGDLIVTDGGSLGEAFGAEWFRAEGGTGVGSHTIGANTHVHPNWVFSSPGEYQVGITQTATLNDGTAVSGTATLNFNVGGAGNADDGHFDFGPTVGCAGAAPAGAEGAPQSSASAGGAGTGTSSATTGTAKPAGAATKRAVDGGPLAVTGFEPLNVIVGVFALGLAVMGAGVIYRSRRDSARRDS
nr:choice-of-anchor M domain-containing protein [Corynebacterium lactis]